MSPAYADTNDGYFEHAYSTPQMTSGGTGTPKPRIYGAETVWKNGTAYPNAYWAKIEVVPVRDPNNRNRWIHPDNLSAAKKSANAVSGALNKVTGVPGNIVNAFKNSQYGQAASKAAQEYDRLHPQKKTAVLDENGRPTWTTKGNAIGRAATIVRGVAGQEAGNIKSGAQAAMEEYDRKHSLNARIATTDKNGNVVYKDAPKSNAVGRAMAGATGAIGASAVGRAGQAAFNALKDKAIASRDSFMKALDKYLKGDNAKANRSQVLQELQTKGGQMMAAIGKAFGTDSGRASTLATLTGTASGIAAGIAQSNAGKAAMSAGKAVFNAAGNAYGAAKNGVRNALEGISQFFNKTFNKRNSGGGSGMARNVATTMAQ